MPLQSIGDIRFFVFDSLGSGVTHAIFARKGGVSPKPWASLNVGGTVGDDAGRVQENRRRALAVLHRDPASIFDAWQVHGTEVAIAEKSRPPETPHRQADIILTDKPGVTLMMRFADCVPILLYDPVRRVAGMAHAGWLGTVRGAAKAAVEAMQRRLGSKPTDILAAIGPSIGPDHYEIGHEVAMQVRQSFGDYAQELLTVRNGRTFLDLWAANRRQLATAGVQRIEIAGLCTACHTEDWFSHRAEKGRTGRFGAIIALI